MRVYLVWYYWSLKGSTRRLRTVISMFFSREVRLYYLYSTGQVVTITASNYLKKVKMDAGEIALLECVNVFGEITVSKGERF